MAGGGKRPGAGRPKGVPNKRNAETVAKAQAVGMLPHEFLCAIAQGLEIDGEKPTFEQRIDAAKAAAPFFAPKLASVNAQHSGPGGGPMRMVVERHIIDPSPSEE
ncbi:hypothetical protein M5E06_10365 [Azospirillum sp. A1-3]|uniref:hypothetical protein n=1 Tax=Azospirillum sp. A1-3 TaxID=185874 RepID=UPI002077426C|nr:hypothetical protein [Azospirillum sp. A1-3]MCM8734597.1 hypothetical protein [Azospirillum sp. A1-3]